MSYKKQWAQLGILAFSLVVAACSNDKHETGEAPAQAQPSYGEEKANIDLWLERMEVGSRELYSAREAVVAAVKAKPGEVIADIGAGTGLYTLLLADAVGPEGAVFAVDIEPRFLTLINRRASDADLTHITPVLGRHEAMFLPAGSLDAAFISDTYNYFEQPQAMMASVHAALKPGGRLYILDFDLVAGAPRTQQNDHVRVGREALALEIEESGFTLVEDIAVEGLDETYMLQFQKAGAP